MNSFNLSTLVLIWLADFILVRVGLFVLFKKANLNPWMALVPILNWWYWQKMVGRPNWFIVGLCLPVFNLVFRFLLINDTLKSFGHAKLYQLLLGYLLRWVYFPYMAFGDRNLVYAGPAASKAYKSAKPTPKNSIREWTEILFIVILFYSGFRGNGPFQTMHITNTGSESSIRVGDYVLINKWTYGCRAPITPLALGFLGHQTTFFGIPTFTTAIELPYCRTMGMKEIKHNDLIVFNVPNNLVNHEELTFPADRKTYYAQRCVGLPGDVFSIKDNQVMINNRLLAGNSNMLHAFILIGNSNFQLSSSWLKKHNIKEVTADGLTEKDVKEAKGQGPFIIHTTADNAEKIKLDKSVKSLDPFKIKTEIQQFIDPEYFKSTNTTWTGFNFGPIKLPKRGERIELNINNYKLYELAITKYEGNEASTDGIHFFINGREVKYYTFKYNYYFMLGDNRDNALDSRAFGMVPENHIEGAPVLTILGRNQTMLIENGMPVKDENGAAIYSGSEIDWSRVFKKLNN